METGSATAGVNLDMLEAGATLLTPFLTPAHITDIRALLGAAQGTGQGEKILRFVRSLQAGLTVVLERQPEGQPRAERAESASARKRVFEQPHLLSLLMEWLAADARYTRDRRQLRTLALVCK